MRIGTRFIQEQSKSATLAVLLLSRRPNWATVCKLDEDSLTDERGIRLGTHAARKKTHFSSCIMCESSNSSILMSSSLCPLPFRWSFRRSKIIAERSSLQDHSTQRNGRSIRHIPSLYLDLGFVHFRILVRSQVLRIRRLRDGYPRVQSTTLLCDICMFGTRIAIRTAASAVRRSKVAVPFWVFCSPSACICVL